MAWRLHLILAYAVSLSCFSFPPFWRRVALAAALPLALSGCNAGRNAFTESGQGSYYADKFTGRPTASGETYRPGRLTAAHNTLPFGTRIRVTNVRTHRSVKVVVNDRGPHVKGRIADFKAPRRVDFVAELPRNQSGKLLKRELRAERA